MNFKHINTYLLYLYVDYVSLYINAIVINTGTKETISNFYKHRN